MIFLYNKNYQRNIKAQLNFYKETARKTPRGHKSEKEKSMYYVDEYKADRNRYETMQYNRCGKSGLKLPVVSLGLWHNFGSKDNYDMMKTLCFTAFDNGITHFDLANNYGPIYGSAEENFGRIMRDFLRPYRNELIISTKAG